MHHEKDLSIAKKFINREKDLSIAKRICRSRKRFMRHEKDLCIVKKICRSGFNLCLCFALMGFRTIQFTLKNLKIKYKATG